MQWLDSITSSKDIHLSRLREMVRTEEPGVLQAMGLQRVGYDSATEQQQQVQRQQQGGRGSWTQADVRSWMLSGCILGTDCLGL